MIRGLFACSVSAVVLLLTGCLTTSGTYRITANRFDGTPLMNGHMMAEGSGIYSVKNAICVTEPGAVITIKDATTGQELQSESPHECRGQPFSDVSLQAANQKLENQFSPIRLMAIAAADQTSCHRRVGGNAWHQRCRKLSLVEGRCAQRFQGQVWVRGGATF